MLAIPQSRKASVSIIENNEMKVGNNTIQISVVAEDRITSKKYELIVYRRNEQEELQYEQEKESEAERLSAILEEQSNNRDVNEVEKNNNIVWVIVVVVLGLTLIAGIIYIIRKKQKEID